MATKKLKQILFKIESTAEFLKVTDPEYKSLVIIDMFLNWCGPVDCLEQNYRTLSVNYNGLEFYTASEDFIPEDIKTNLKHGPLSCRPRFAIFLEGEIKEEITGADFTAIQNAVEKYAPQGDD